MREWNDDYCCWVDYSYLISLPHTCSYVRFIDIFFFFFLPFHSHTTIKWLNYIWVKSMGRATFFLFSAVLLLFLFLSSLTYVYFSFLSSKVITDLLNQSLVTFTKGFFKYVRKEHLMIDERDFPLEARSNEWSNNWLIFLFIAFFIYRLKCLLIFLTMRWQ